MRTTGFLIRVAICFILSLMPASELENLIYSQRMTVRGQWVRTSDILIFEGDSSHFSHPTRLLQLESQFLSQKARLVLYPARYNSNDLQLDGDGVVRSAILIPKGGRPTTTYAAALQLKLDDKLESKAREPHLINFGGPSGSFPHCSVESFLEKGEDGVCSQIEGKIVLLAENDDFLPLVRTPLGEMTHVEAIANELHTQLRSKPIYRATWLERSLISFAMILLAAFYILYYPVKISAMAVFGMGFLVIVVIFQGIFQIFDIYIPSANISAAMLISYLVFTGYRMAFQDSLQWKSIKQAQYLKELDRMKTNFLSLVSHDLKTPLARIQAVVERLKREMSLPDDERSDWKELLESIESSNKELQHYISSILNLSKIESQKVILNKKSNDVNVLIRQAIRRLSALAHTRNIVIEESLDPLFSIECDEDLMRQVITNLIDNAIKYSPPQSKVIIRSREEGDFVRVEVEDFGPGIPQDKLPLMFRKFSRFMRPLNEQVKGTGLGLYLSKYFIELHGGTIDFKSVEGKGSVFTFTLPIHST